MQTTRDLFMVRPACFGPNMQTAQSNAFQRSGNEDTQVVAAAALTEFDALAEALRAAGVRLCVFEDTAVPPKPDAVFPNNWITTHANGDVFLFPLQAPNRRPERRRDIVDALAAEQGFAVGRVTDLSAHERAGRFLEGTGSMVLDRQHRVAYAALSSRTHPGMLEEFVRAIGYEACAFDTRDAAGRPIYHTNVMLAIGSRFAVICGAVIADHARREMVRGRLADTGRQVIDIAPEQMAAFAGNLLEVRGAGDEPLIVLSRAAQAALTGEQRERLRDCGRLLPAGIGTIERVGGGGVRCMLAEIFLPRSASPAQGEGHGV